MTTVYYSSALFRLEKSNIRYGERTQESTQFSLGKSTAKYTATGRGGQYEKNTSVAQRVQCMVRGRFKGKTKANVYFLQ